MGSVTPDESFISVRSVCEKIDAHTVYCSSTDVSLNNHFLTTFLICIDAKKLELTFIAWSSTRRLVKCGNSSMN